jgi:hypothetical protein
MKMTPAELDDLQAWLRHGRIGTGRGYQAEVERSRAIEAKNNAQPGVVVPASRCGAE